jgi:hypothetical protein
MLAALGTMISTPGGASRFSTMQTLVQGQHCAGGLNLNLNAGRLATLPTQGPALIMASAVSDRSFRSGGRG